MWGWRMHLSPPSYFNLSPPSSTIFLVLHFFFGVRSFVLNELFFVLPCERVCSSLRRLLLLQPSFVAFSHELLSFWFAPSLWYFNNRERLGFPKISIISVCKSISVDVDWLKFNSGFNFDWFTEQLKVMNIQIEIIPTWKQICINMYTRHLNSCTHMDSMTFFEVLRCWLQFWL